MAFLRAHRIEAPGRDGPATACSCVIRSRSGLPSRSRLPITRSLNGERRARQSPNTHAPAQTPGGQALSNATSIFMASHGERAGAARAGGADAKGLCRLGDSRSLALRWRTEFRRAQARSVSRIDGNERQVQVCSPRNASGCCSARPDARRMPQTLVVPLRRRVMEDRSVGRLCRR